MRPGLPLALPDEVSTLCSCQQLVCIFSRNHAMKSAKKIRKHLQSSYKPSENFILSLNMQKVTFPLHSFTHFKGGPCKIWPVNHFKQSLLRFIGLEQREWHHCHDTVPPAGLVSDYRSLVACPAPSPNTFVQSLALLRSLLLLQTS